MLTGLITPSAGDCTINGKSIRTEMRDIRKSLGICPQYDVLFDRLTVEEHLTLYATLKGVSRKDVPQQVENYIKQIGLEPKKHYYASALSGGQRRKLSVAIALIGGSQTVFLDEPTSGMVRPIHSHCIRSSYFQSN